MRMRYKNGEFSLDIKHKNGDETFYPCFTMPYEMNYEAFFFIAALSGKSLNNHHYIHSIATVDLDNKIDTNDRAY